MGKDDADPAHKVRGLLDAGVRTFVNLMEEGEVDHDGEPFRPYEPLVAEEALRRGVSVTCLRFPIVDVSVPTTAQMGVIQAALDESLARGDTVYVHCWGGRGRTGTVVGAFLVRHGFAEPDDFVDAIAARRGPEAVGPSPETPAQERFVRNYLGAAQAQGR